MVEFGFLRAAFLFAPARRMSSLDKGEGKQSEMLKKVVDSMILSIL